MKEHEVEEALSHEVEDRRLYWVQMIHVDRYWIAVQMIGIHSWCRVDRHCMHNGCKV
jgi:hypothetical protein